MDIDKAQPGTDTGLAGIDRVVTGKTNRVYITYTICIWVETGYI